MASAQSASLYGGLGSPQVGSRGLVGRAPGGYQAPGPHLKQKAFCQFSYKKWPNVNDLNENLPSCLRQTASRSHDQPQILVNGVGGGRPVRP